MRDESSYTWGTYFAIFQMEERSANSFVSALNESIIGSYLHRSHINQILSAFSNRKKLFVSK